MSQEWRPRYDDPEPPMPLWLFIVVLGGFIVVVCLWLALIIG